MSSLGAVPHSTASGTGRPAGRAAHREESRVLTEQIAAAPGAEKAPDYELRGARLLADATRPTGGVHQNRSRQTPPIMGSCGQSGVSRGVL